MASPFRNRIRPKGRSLADFGMLSAAEQALLDGCRLGEVAVIAKTLPDAETDENRVRADFLRFLALGGDDKAPVHEHGVQIQGAWLTGLLDFVSARIPHPLVIWNSRVEKLDCGLASIPFLALDGSRIEQGINGDRLMCETGLFLRDRFHLSGGARFLGARIGGNLDCATGLFENGDGYALACDGMTVGGDVFLRGKFVSKKGVRLPGVTIGGDIGADGALFQCEEEVALSFDSARIGGGVFLVDGFHAKGEVRLLGATIGESMNCQGSIFENPDGDALSCDRAVIRGSLFMSENFQAIGTVRLSSAIIGNLFCGGGTIEARNGLALVGDGAKIAGDIQLNRNFRAVGAVRLQGATIGGDLACSNAHFIHPDGDALICSGVRVDGHFYLRSLGAVEGGITLSSTHVAHLCDDAESWALAHGQIELDGFSYGRLASYAPTDSRARVTWLDRQRPDHLAKEFRPQPWEQLISVLRAMGHPNEARRVAVAKQQRLRRARRITWGAWPFHVVYGALVGYGYHFPRLVGYIIGVWLACAAAYWLAVHPPGAVPASAIADTYLPQAVRPATYLIAPTSQEPSAACLIARAAAHRGDPCPPPPADYGSFDPFIYSADVLLPIVNLGYKAEWKPVVSDAAHRPLTAGHWLRYLYWAEIAFGWIAGALLVGVVGNLMKKD